MATLKRRIELQEQKYWRELIEATDHYLEGRSLEDVEFFCVHGYLPDDPIPGRTCSPERLSWKERWEKWKEYKRAVSGRTVEEREFFCVHGRWPAR